MSRAERLLELLQILRRRRRPIPGNELAAELGVSLRSLYRDIATLKGQGADIRGEPGIGYVLRPGFLLPPLMFSEEEIEAIVLGSRWVAKQPDARLATSARDALAKITSVLPPQLRDLVDATTLMVGPPLAKLEGIDLATIRDAIRSETKLEITYRREPDEHAAKRIVWPFALGFFDQVRIVVAWCELRRGIRHFRTDRIVTLTATSEPYPKRRRVLLAEWRAQQRKTPPA
ncbi:MAG: YafY family transcriptional regulator [Polyangiaceae bacterium]|nr:YafY family transcriptional regulator [Polyangiaceae bacterium]